MNWFQGLMTEVAQQLSEQTHLSWRREEPDSPHSDNARLYTLETAARTGLNQEPWPYKLFIHLNRDRIEVIGMYPTTERDHRIKWPKISCDVGRGAEQIAADIRKRLLRRYDYALAAVAEVILREEEYLLKKATITEQLIAAEPRAYKYVDRDRIDGPLRENGARWTAFVGAEYVQSLEIHWLPVDLAVKIVKLLREANDK